jgi:tetratricopeptide (TPR) repeat protein
MRVVLACVLLTAVVASPARPITAAGETSRAGEARPARQRAVTTRDALDRYLGGDYLGALEGRPQLTRFDTAEAERWITSGGAAAVDRRRLATCLFALEYSGVRPALLSPLLTWARGVMSRQPPRATEATWLRASIALAEGLDRWVFLLRGLPGRPVKGKPVPPVPHITFARSRFPDDPYFRMAEAIGAEVTASRPLDRLAAPAPQSGTGWDRVEADLLEGGGPHLEERRAALERAAALLEGLTSHATLGAEAHLRLGYVRLREGQRDAALAHFDQVASRTENTSLRYLGHLYSGWLLGGVGRVDEAAIAYRGALRFAPGAQAATTLLVALLARHDRLPDAEVAAETFFQGEAPSDDPWRAYFIGDFPEYSRLVGRLREALK